jgi:hypothetical protein
MRRRRRPKKWSDLPDDERIAMQHKEAILRSTWNAAAHQKRSKVAADADEYPKEIIEEDGEIE